MQFVWRFKEGKVHTTKLFSMKKISVQYQSNIWAAKWYTQYQIKSIIKISTNRTYLSNIVICLYMSKWVKKLKKIPESKLIQLEEQIEKTTTGVGNYMFLT